MSETWLRILVLVLIFAAVLLAVEAIVGWLTSRRTEDKEINVRLQMIARGVDRGQTMQQLRRRDMALPDSLPKWLISPARKIERNLIAAGVTMPTGQLVMLMLAAPIVLLALIVLGLFIAGTALSFGQFVMVATFAGVVGLVIPLLALQFHAEKRRKRIQEQFPVALDVFVRGLRAGHPVAAALDLLTVEMPDPIGSQFGLVVDEVTYGADLRDALQNMADRWEMEDMRMFVVSLSVQSETGGNLAEILENLSKVIRERASMMMKVKALSSEGRMTALMLTAMPVIAFAMLFSGNPSFYLDVADDPAFMPGFIGLMLLYAIGFYSIRRMIDLKV